MMEKNNIIVICNVEHDIVPGVCPFCERDSFRTRCAEMEAVKEIARLRADNERLQKELAEKEGCLRDWERSSAELGTVLIRSERYNELLAIEARVGDVEGVAKVLTRQPSEPTFSVTAAVLKYEKAMLDARALRDYLKGGGG